MLVFRITSRCSVGSFSNRNPRKLKPFSISTTRDFSALQVPCGPLISSTPRFVDSLLKSEYHPLKLIRSGRRYRFTAYISIAHVSCISFRYSPVPLLSTAVGSLVSYFSSHILLHVQPLRFDSISTASFAEVEHVFPRSVYPLCCYRRCLQFTHVPLKVAAITPTCGECQDI